MEAAILKVTASHRGENIGQRGYSVLGLCTTKKWLEFSRANLDRQSLMDFFLCFFCPMFFSSHRWFEVVFLSDFGVFFRWRSFFSVLTSGGLSLKLVSLVTSLLPVASCTVTRLLSATFRGSEGNTKTAWPWYSGFCFRCNHTCQWKKGHQNGLRNFEGHRTQKETCFLSRVTRWILREVPSCLFKGLLCGYDLLNCLKQLPDLSKTKLEIPVPIEQRQTTR